MELEYKIHTSILLKFYFRGNTLFGNKCGQ